MKYLWVILFLWGSFLPVLAQTAKKTTLPAAVDTSQKCIDKKKILLTRTWQMKSVEIPGVVYTQEQKQEMADAFKHHTLTFLNGKVTIQSPNAVGNGYDTSEVFWTIQKDCQTIKIFNPKDKSTSISHFIVTENKLVWDQGDLGVVTFIPSGTQ